MLVNYEPYYDIVNKTSYKTRSGKKITELFHKYHHNTSITSQDAGKDFAIRMSKYKRARFIVNRATGIGTTGFHNTPKKEKKVGDCNNEIFVDEGDRDIKQLILVDLDSELHYTLSELPLG